MRFFMEHIPSPTLLTSTARNWAFVKKTVVPSLMCIAKRKAAKNSLSRCRMYSSNSSKTAVYITPPSPSANRLNGEIGITESVYTVGILNFVFDEDKNSKDYFHHEVKLMDVNTKKVFYDKLTFIYLELPKFTKTEHELETLFEKWVFVLKNLSRLLERPAALQERVFNRLFEAASIARFTPKQLREYEDSVKAYRDIVNAVNTARKEGHEEGLEKGHEEEKIEIARKMKSDGLPDDTISKYTGLPIEEIERI